jgi:hypothetical protein
MEDEGQGKPWAGRRAGKGGEGGEGGEGIDTPSVSVN